MYIYTLNYIETTQVLDLRSWTWSKIEAEVVESTNSSSITFPCAGHSLVCIEKVHFSFEKPHFIFSSTSTNSGIFWILMIETLLP